MPDNEPLKCNGVARPTGGGETPYGYWHCSAEGWVWVPSYGKIADPKQKKPKK